MGGEINLSAKHRTCGKGEAARSHTKSTARDLYDANYDMATMP